MADPDVDDQVAAHDYFFPTAVDAVRLCSGPCGEVKPSSFYPVVAELPGARYSCCSICRDHPVLESDGPEDDATTTTKNTPYGGLRERARRRRGLLTDLVAEIAEIHRGVAVSTNQFYEEIFDRVDFVPSEATLRSVIRDLVRTDDRFVKVGAEFYAWAPDGAVPPPPAPRRVQEMIERRRRGETLDEVGAAFGVTRERVRQLMKKYGGPSSAEVRESRAADVLAAEREHQTRITTKIRGVLAGGAPMTPREVAAATGFDVSDVSKCWPTELDHLRLWSGSTGESRWTDDEILAALRAAAVYEFPLTATAYTDLLQVGQVDGPSVPRIGQRFGTWTAACAAAGVVAGEPWNRDYDSRWSDDDLLNVMGAYLHDPAAPNSAHRFDEWKRVNAPDGPSAQTLRNRFGSWTEAKRRALTQKGLQR